MKKKNWLWFILFILITGLTIWSVVSQSSSFDWEELAKDIKESNKIWLILAFLATLSNIVFEAIALKAILKVTCPEKVHKRRYLLYSSADLYFSAITPFTSGGQPAMVAFMLQDKIRFASITSALILDYIACTLTNLLGMIIAIIISPKFIVKFSALSITLVIIGAVILIAMNVLLFWLLFNSKLFKKIATKFLDLLKKLFHYKKYDQKIEKLNKTAEEYEECASIMKANKWPMIKVFLYTFAQKLGKTLASVFIFFAVIKEYKDGFKVWCIQVMSDLGSSLVPLPGGVGAREYILIDGFSNLESIDSAANLGLMCQAISFYLGVIVGGLIILIAILKRKTSKAKENTNV